LLSPASAASTPNYVEGTDAAAVVFDPLKVNNFELEMSDENFNRLTYPNVSWDNEGPWLETVMKFTMDKKEYGPYKVGVHLKGAWGSWRDVYGKAAFKIKMNAFVKKQTLFGITKFTLNNMVQDPSYIHEALSYRLFRAVGVPTPRVGYANVTLNGRDYGLHLNVETVDTTMLKRWGLTNTHLYKGGVPNFPELYSGSESYFQVEDGSETDRQDLTRFLDTMTNFSGEQWWDEITQIANMKEITLDIATEAYVGHWDGYPYNRNNYYITYDALGSRPNLEWWNGLFWLRNPIVPEMPIFRVL
jgi:spore coat protein CotH